MTGRAFNMLRAPSARLRKHGPLYFALTCPAPLPFFKASPFFVNPRAASILLALWQIFGREFYFCGSTLAYKGESK
jgi:hypothetical protein